MVSVYYRSDISFAALIGALATISYYNCGGITLIID